MHLSIRVIVIVLLAVVVGKIIWDMIDGAEARPRLLAALTLAMLGLGVLEFRAQAAEARYANVVSQIAHRDVGVRCQGIFGEFVDVGAELGSVRFDADGNPAGHTDIRRSACNAIKDYERGDKSVKRDQAVAVHVLAHEAIHLRGVMDEAITECTGLQHTAQVARALGADAEQARALAEYYWRAVYPQLADAYRSPDCADGGRLDLNPDSSVWP
jgi:hypothetical protein